MGYNRDTNKFYCDCGCGEECNPLSNFKPGHWLRTREGLEIASRNGEARFNTSVSEQEIEDRRAWMSRYWASPEGQAHAESIRGEKSPRWKGGYVPAAGYGYEAIREYILARDKETCQGCGSKLNLQVHHIDGDTDNEEERNLITVCEPCNHKASNREEENYWKLFYSEKIDLIYGKSN